MQINDIGRNTSGNLKKWLWVVFKIAVSGICAFVLISQFDVKIEQFQGVKIPEGLAQLLVFQFLLMGLNWWLEIKRWQISVASIESISFRQATVDVLSGLALGWILPFTSGDLLARLAARSSKVKSLGAIVLNRSVMLVLTILVGLKGLSQIVEVKVIYLFFTGFAMLAGYLVYAKIPGKVFSYFNEVSAGIIFSVILLSVIRYAVFIFQFTLLITFFLPDLTTLDAIWGVGWIFLSRTFVPSLFGGLGVRELSASIYFQPLVSEIALAIVPVTLIWIINTAIPSIIGVLLIWKLRIKLARWPWL